MADDFVNHLHLIDNEFQPIDVKSVFAKTTIIVFIFSASTVETGDLTKKLKQIYDYSKRQPYTAVMQIIYVSFDADNASFNRDFNTHHASWYAIPFKNPKIEELRWMYSITHLPEVIVVKRNGEIITTKAKEQLLERGLNVLPMWMDLSLPMDENDEFCSPNCD